MSATLKLRDYQRETIDSLFDAWSESMKRPAVVLPTGAGKTVVFSHLIQQFRDWWDSGGMGNGVEQAPGKRVIVLVHRDELADQAISKIRAVAPDLSVGKVKADDDDVRADVMVCSVQTVSRSRRLNRLVWHSSIDPDSPGAVGLIITDECHHAAARSYQTIYSAFPEALHAGFTATLQRGDDVGLGSTWDDVVYSRSPLWMMKHGYLVQPRAWTEDIGGLDLKGVKTSSGDYQVGDLGRALEESDLASSLPALHKERAAGRPTVVFTPTVATAHGVAEAFMEFGTTASVVTGETPREDRLRIFEDFRLGRSQVLVNCMVLTEGFDAPWASCAVIARPTRSQPLYVQMVGRVLRPWPGKTDAVILNVAGAGGKLCTLVDLEPGAVQEVKEGESLEEAEERELLEEEEQAQQLTKRARQIRVTETDLFAASHQAWLRTAGGVMFISAGEWTYFLWPSPESGWDVCRKPKRGRWERTAHQGLTMELAMSWAEAEAEDHGSFSVARSASWRKGKPSDAQLNYAYGLGIDTAEMNKAQVSDSISVVLESNALDPFIGVV
jgi:superfamily II DNA or RNA helicase